MSRHQNHAKIREDDYCSYVSKLEKSTSMFEGPHFPMAIKNKGHKVVEEEEVCVERPRSGLFGRPEEMQEFKDKVTCKVTETYY